MIALMLILFCIIVNVLSNPASLLCKCESGDNVCAKDVVKAIYPLVLEANTEIGTEDLDPMIVPNIEGSLPKLTFTLFNTTVIGLKSCAVQNVKYNDQTLKVILLCPGFTLKGQYDVDGLLISIPFEGNGDYTIITNEYHISAVMKLKTIIGKYGKTYKIIEDFELETEPLESIHYDAKNLFNGRKDLGDEALEFSNGHWKEVAYIVQKPIFNACFEGVMKNMNKYIKSKPCE